MEDHAAAQDRPGSDRDRPGSDRDRPGGNEDPPDGDGEAPRVRRKIGTRARLLEKRGSLKQVRGRGGAKGGGRRRALAGSEDHALSLREAKKRETRDAIRYFARDLFDTHGYEGTTIRAIAEEAGVAVGTVHLHFKDKENLLLECLIDDLEAAEADSWAGISEDLGIRDQLLARAEDGFQQWAQQPSLSRAILRRVYFSRSPGIRRLRALDEDAAQRVADLLRRGQERGEVRKDVDVDLAAKAIFSFYLTSVLDWLGSAEEDTRDPSVEDGLDEHTSMEGELGGDVSLEEELDEDPSLEEKLDEVRRYLDQMFEGIGAPS